MLNVNIKTESIVITLDEILKNDKTKESHKVIEKKVGDVSKRKKGTEIHFSVFEFGFKTYVHKDNFYKFEVDSIRLLSKGKKIKVDKDKYKNLTDIREFRDSLNLLRLLDEDAILEFTLISKYLSLKEESFKIEKNTNKVYGYTYFSFGEKEVTNEKVMEILEIAKTNKTIHKEIFETLQEKSIIEKYSLKLNKTKAKDFKYFLELLTKEKPNLSDEEKLIILKIVLEKIIESGTMDEYRKRMVEIKNIKEQILECVIEIEKENKERFNFYGLDFFLNLPEEDVLFRVLILLVLRNKLKEYQEYSSNIENTNGINRVDANIHLYEYILAKFKFFLYEKQIFEITAEIITENIEEFLSSMGDNLFPKRLKSETLIVKSKMNKLQIR